MFNAWVAQLVEHSPEEGRVTSSNLVPSTFVNESLVDKPVENVGNAVDRKSVCYIVFTLS